MRLIIKKRRLVSRRNMPGDITRARGYADMKVGWL